MPLVAETNFSVSLAIGTALVQDVFDRFEGGEVETEVSTYRAGGMADPESFISSVAVAPIRLARAFRGERDAPLVRWFRERLGHGCVVTKQALNPDKTPVPGGLETFRGKLSGVATPNHDSMGTSVTYLQLTIAPDGLPA